MKYLGLDYGTKRIGVATSDSEGKVAFPLATVPAGREALQKIDELVKKESIGKIVIGESRNFKNEPNAVMEDIEQFKKDLAEVTGLEVVYELEFMTSAQAERGESKNLDASAAALILQSFLDKMKPHGSN